MKSEARVEMPEREMFRTLEMYWLHAKQCANLPADPKLGHFEWLVAGMHELVDRYARRVRLKAELGV